MKKNAPRKIRILLVDDHLVVRMGLAAVLSLEPDMDVVGEADSGVTAVSQALSLKPDVVVMDLLMPKLNGDQATARILAVAPNAKILILTSFGNADELKNALEAGAIGALPKTASQAEIIAAIRSAVTGSPIADGLTPIPSANADSQSLLSERQTEILGLVARGFTNKDIADALHITLETVKDHLKKIFVQLGAASRTEASTIASDLGIISRS